MFAAAWVIMVEQYGEIEAEKIIDPPVDGWTETKRDLWGRDTAAQASARAMIGLTGLT